MIEGVSIPCFVALPLDRSGFIGDLAGSRDGWIVFTAPKLPRGRLTRRFDHLAQMTFRVQDRTHAGGLPSLIGAEPKIGWPASAAYS
jgi:hypothetical protein